MSRSRTVRRATVLSAVTAAAAASLLAGAGPAAAMPFEGDPSPTQCVRVVPLPGFVRSPDVFSVGLYAALVSRPDC